MAAYFFKRILHKIAMVGPGGYKVRPKIHAFRGVNMGNNVWICQYVYIDELNGWGRTTLSS